MMSEEVAAPTENDDPRFVGFVFEDTVPDPTGYLAALAGRDALCEDCLWPVTAHSAACPRGAEAAGRIG